MITVAAEVASNSLIFTDYSANTMSETNCRSGAEEADDRGSESCSNDQPIPVELTCQR